MSAPYGNLNEFEKKRTKTEFKLPKIEKMQDHYFSPVH